MPNNERTVSQFMELRTIMGLYGQYSYNNIFYTEHGFNNRVDFEISVIYDEAIIDKIMQGTLKTVMKVVPYEKADGNNQISPSK